ncbi:hypothetical protein BJP36_43600 [Moorena producens JHB]|uniref:Uncharacterized protein n=1 Tax=Moorena producens (strain JHB) TaxID=1454205 RepID=A0A9Q9STA2_MOOP1|nr:hypothetical protein [Moorena producens]WAN69248.1 hypothetical protein BJP36_43600 [Moorena producens JHB]
MIIFVPCCLLPTLYSLLPVPMIRRSAFPFMIIPAAVVQGFLSSKMS